jgi:hypothetical protein
MGAQESQPTRSVADDVVVSPSARRLSKKESVLFAGSHAPIPTYFAGGAGALTLVIVTSFNSTCRYFT